MRQFKLIKNYPGFDVNPGVIIDFDEGLTYRELSWIESGNNEMVKFYLHLKDCENNPKFWEEITTPQTEITYTKMVTEKDFLELRKEMEQLQQHIMLLSNKLAGIVLTPPYPAPVYPPNQPWNPYPNNPSYPWYEGGTCVTTTTDKIEINEQK